MGVLVTLVDSLDPGVQVLSVETCTTLVIEKNATKANPAFNLRNENRYCLNKPIFIIPTFLYSILQSIVNHFDLGWHKIKCISTIDLNLK